MPTDRSISRRGVIGSAAVAALGASAMLAKKSYADDASILTSSEVVDFTYIDCAELYVGDTQNIVVSLKGFSGITEPLLVLRNLDTEAEYIIQASKTTDVSSLFTCSASEIGSFEIAELSFVYQGQTYRVDFSDADASYRSFAVSSPEAEPMSDTTGEEGPSLQVYSTDGGDGIQEASSIEDAAAVAMAEAGNSRSRSVEQRVGNLVVALDPGHVGSNSGALGNGLAEADANWKIAQYCKAELETYEGVTVVYTVTNSDRLNPSTELVDRVNSAVRQGADVLVSLHLNSTGSGSAHGAEVWAPYNSGYNSETHAVGTELGKKILAQLEALGLTNRGVKFRWIEDDADYQYSDGSDGDYYGIIRNARKANLPAVIVEHAFIDNWSDYQNFLRDDAKLQALGASDARGIANHFGLSHAQGTVYRLYYAPTLDHHYTMDANEYRVLGTRGWKQEGIAWYSND